MLKGYSAVFTDQVQGAHRLRAVSGVGQAFPLHCTANGKALLSVLPDEKVQRFLSKPLARLTRQTVVKPAQLLAEIEACRKSGVAFDEEEHTEGIAAVGTAFLDPLGRAVALSVPVPTARYKRIKTEVTQRLLAARAAVRESLGDPPSSR